MRNTKEIVIGERRILLSELTQREIRDLFRNFSGKQVTIDEVFAVIVEKLLKISKDEFLDFTPSELLQIYQAIREVNSTFFSIPDYLEKAGLGSIWDQIKASFQNEFASKVTEIQQTKPEM